jgi:hypothetical protein
MTIHMSKKWPQMVVEPDMCSQFYIETVYIIPILFLHLLRSKWAGVAVFYVGDHSYIT